MEHLLLQSKRNDDNILPDRCFTPTKDTTMRYDDRITSVEMNDTINHTECWNEINMQDIAESCEFCKVVTLNPFTGVKESHIMVPSDKVLEGLKNGGLKRYSERSQIVSVDADDINRLW